MIEKIMSFLLLLVIIYAILCYNVSSNMKKRKEKKPGEPIFLSISKSFHPIGYHWWASFSPWF